MLCTCTGASSAVSSTLLTCSHLLVLLLDCSANYRRSVTSCTDGTAQRQACDVFRVCLATDLFSVHAWGGERPSVPICLLWLSAFWLHQFSRWVSDRWRSVCARDRAAQTTPFNTGRSKRKEKIATNANSTIKQGFTKSYINQMLFSVASLRLCCLFFHVESVICIISVTVMNWVAHMQLPKIEIFWVFFLK